MEIKCSICGSDYKFEYNKDDPLPSHFPFCSKRCKAIDLGKWLNEVYRISTPMHENDQLTETESILDDENKEDILAKLLDNDTNTV